MPQPPNLQKMLAEAQAMLAQQQEAQDKLKEQTVDASAGGGMVKVVFTGDMRLQELTIDPDAVDPEDVEMLQDMVMAAINEAMRQATDLQAKATGGGMGGMGGPAGLPGGMPPGAGGQNRAARRAQKRK